MEPVEGHWATGLANALDGSEDRRMSGEAAKIWRACGMFEEREAVLAWVRQGRSHFLLFLTFCYFIVLFYCLGIWVCLFVFRFLLVRFLLFHPSRPLGSQGKADGTLNWDAIHTYIQHPEDIGVEVEGQELLPGAPEADDPVEDAAYVEKDEDVSTAWAAAVRADWSEEKLASALVPVGGGPDADVVAASEDPPSCLYVRPSMFVAVRRYVDASSVVNGSVYFGGVLLECVVGSSGSSVAKNNVTGRPPACHDLRQDRGRSAAREDAAGPVAVPEGQAQF